VRPCFSPFHFGGAVSAADCVMNEFLITHQIAAVIWKLQRILFSPAVISNDTKIKNGKPTKMPRYPSYSHDEYRAICRLLLQVFKSHFCIAKYQYVYI